MYIRSYFISTYVTTNYCKSTFYWNSYNVAQLASRFSICCQKAKTGGCWPPLDRFIN